MISTPDAVLQAVIKRSLVESGCPDHIISELMENAHERRWPPGLSTLETRQLNRRQYESYVTKRIPGKQVTHLYYQHYCRHLFMCPSLTVLSLLSFSPCIFHLSLICLPTISPTH